MNEAPFRILGPPLNMKRLLTVLIAALACATSGSAQQAWFVNPATGSDGNTGQSTADAFRSLTHALTVAGAGDNIFCEPGTYSGSETFPIALQDGVRVSALGGTPVFDGPGAGAGFVLAGDITQETEISGLTIRDFAIGLSIVAGRDVNGLIFTGVAFDDCATGVQAILSSGAAEQEVAVEECAFTGTGGATGVVITVSDGTTLSGGQIFANTFSGDHASAVRVLVTEDGIVQSGFAVERNTISGADTGIEVSATGGGGNPLDVASAACAVRANSVTGDAGPASVGLRLSAAIGVVDEGGRVSSRIEFNEIQDCGTAVRIATVNDFGSIADVISDFYGNVFADGTTAILLDATLPDPTQRNADPNFGGDVDGGVACLNTFTGFVTDFALDLDQAPATFAQFNHFDGAPVVVNGTVNFIPIYSDTLEGSVATTGLVSGVAGQELTVTAGAITGFVDYDGGGPTGQIEVLLDTVALAQTDIEALPIGAGLVVTLPALSSGAHTLTVTNPGGQTGEFAFSLSVGTGAGGGPSGCFVATAAHGDYDAPEVRELRGLRDEYLALTGTGRGFIRWYYREGPQAAAWIAERPWARATTRVALQPAVLVSGALTRWSAAARLGFAVLLLGGAFALLRRRPA